jgi:hypothetical protein
LTVTSCGACFAAHENNKNAAKIVASRSVVRLSNFSIVKGKPLAGSAPAQPEFGITQAPDKVTNGRGRDNREIALPIKEIRGRCAVHRRRFCG